MFGEKKLKTLAQEILRLVQKADQAEVLIFGTKQALTRFANNEIHQSVASQEISLQLRVVLGKKIGVVRSGRFDQKGLEALCEQALLMAKHQKEDPGFVSLPKPSKSYPQAQALGKSTLASSPTERAAAVATVISIARSAKLVASGAYDNRIEEIAIANSLGVWAYHSQSKAELSTIQEGKHGSGWAETISKDATEINPEQLAHEAVFRASFGGEPETLAPGEYETILEPEALYPLSETDEFLGYFAIYAPNARIYHEDISYLKGKLGKKIFSSQVTLTDDPLDPEGLPLPFDFEGVPKKRLVVIDKGRAKAIAYDSYYANKYHKPNTGHALPAPNVSGPMPGHLVIKPGTASKEQMVRSIKSGLLITRLHYLRILHYRDLSLTGMTRDGLFIIKNGEMVGRAKNMRFTESLPRIFSGVKSVECKVKKVRSLWGGIVKAPAVHFEKFNFSSATQFS